VTGVEHFEKAEECLVKAGQTEDGSDAERYLLAKAQVHATLALAASQLRSLTAEQAS
jgi:hypothetical protein